MKSIKEVKDKTINSIPKIFGHNAQPFQLINVKEMKNFGGSYMHPDDVKITLRVLILVGITGAFARMQVNTAVGKPCHR